MSGRSVIWQSLKIAGMERRRSWTYIPDTSRLQCEVCSLSLNYPLIDHLGAKLTDAGSRDLVISPEMHVTDKGRSPYTNQHAEGGISP